MTDRAIVTAISPNMWHDYLVFYDSIRRFHDCPIYLICLEMVNWQLEAIKHHKNVHTITMDEDRIEDYKKTHAHWRQWFKPYYMEMISEHETVLWLDIDMVILESLDPLFTHIDRQFLVVGDYFAPKSCLNKYELYKKYKLEIPKDKAHIALNSGVVGFKPIRDKEIMKLWRRKVAIAAQNEEVQSWIALFDQGALLWALQELDLYNLIILKRTWNYPAKKNPYELVTESFGEETGGVKSPNDIIENIRIDNPGAVIAHFAGLPKLAHLCEPDHNFSCTNFRRKNGGREIKRTFITGVERSGFRTLAEIFRRSTNSESWVRHGLTPTLAAEVQARHFGGDFQTHDFLHRMDLYARSDCGFVCEANKNIAFFIKEIRQKLEGSARFIITLRDPVNLIRSRLLNYVVWPDELHTAPPSYREDYRKFVLSTKDNSNNYFRCRPHTAEKMNLLDLHIWEIEHTMKHMIAVLQELPPHTWRFVWMENIRAEIFRLAQFAGKHRIEPTVAEKIARQRYSVGLKIHSQETADWVEDQLNDRMIEIYDRIGQVMNAYNVNIPFAGI